ncbi:rta1 domain protein [Fusarium subglutinans]|uniref:Rta1 domain protein n=1 Tax=Gibberella subglutinans TaxID=42677 RepID=A0A8H5LDG2_GIBSU|nr:rta1 domain protein [Fusarium subglutinans]KAF5589038.1 rta1 domain protein [Fusarium subglutinans]
MVNYYRYEPSLAANILFVVIFALSSGVHLFQIFKTRTWFFIPFLVGSLFETIGFIGRAIGAEQAPDYTFGPYIMQSLLLLLGPTCYAASIYMILGRLIGMLKAEKHSLIRPNWLTKLFLLGDIISIALQGIGGGKLADANTPDERRTGENIIIAGLTVQILFFGLFFIVTGLFHFQFLKDPTRRMSSSGTNWQRSLGHDGELQSKEVYLLVLDAIPMTIASIMFNVFHPSKFLNARSKNLTDSEADEPLGYWQGHSLGTVVGREPIAASNR